MDTKCALETPKQRVSSMHVVMIVCIGKVSAIRIFWRKKRLFFVIEESLHLRRKRTRATCSYVYTSVDGDNEWSHHVASVAKKGSAGTSSVRECFEIELRRSTLRCCGSHLSYAHLKRVSRRKALTRFHVARVEARTEIVDNLMVVPRHIECLAAQERLVWGREASNNSSISSRHIIVSQAGVKCQKE